MENEFLPTHPNPEISKLKADIRKLMEQLEEYKFSCEAGSLAMAVPWQMMKTIVSARS